MSTLGYEQFEDETCRLWKAPRYIMDIVEALKPWIALTQEEEAVLFSEALQFQFRDIQSEGGKSHKTIENVWASYLWLFDWVNYFQYYITPSIKNILLLIQIIEARGLQFTNSEQKSWFEDIKKQANGAPEEQKLLIDSIANIRLFDARGKYVPEEGILPLSIDFKFKAQSGNTARKTIKVAAAKGAQGVINSNETIIETIDEIIGKIGLENIGKMYRRFFALEWLPPEVVNYFINTDKRILEASPEQQQQIWALLAHYFSVKQDWRFDHIITPEGREAHTVTSEVEVDVDTPHTPKKRNLPKLLSRLFDRIHLSKRTTKTSKTVWELIGWAIPESYSNIASGHPYTAEILDASRLALGNPSTAMENVLKQAYKASDIEDIFQMQKSQVQAISKKLWFERDNQVVIRSEAQKGKPNIKNKKTFTMDQVQSRINDILRTPHYPNRPQLEAQIITARQKLYSQYASTFGTPKYFQALDAMKYTLIKTFSQTQGFPHEYQKLERMFTVVGSKEYIELVAMIELGMENSHPYTQQHKGDIEACQRWLQEVSTSVMSVPRNV